ncbi:MAG: MFS transporter [Burkholderiales bacterium]|nr:MFS transporter [Burkholderiales bacterium]
MSAPPTAAPMRRGEFLTLVGVLTLAHTLGTISALTLPAIAPFAAKAYGVPVYAIGYQASLMAFGIIVALVFGGNLSLRWGATRVNQAGLVLVAAGAAALSIPSLACAVPASLSVGIGYGMLTPSASHILIRFTPAHRRNVVFSLKQSGVPLGGVLTATIMPVVTITAGWQWALWLDALAALGMALVMERWRRRWDDDRIPATPLAANPLGAVRIIWHRPRLRLMALAGAGICASQICMQSYTVAMFYEQFSLPLVEAGWILTVAQVGGVCGRVFWGWYADRRRDALLALALLAATLVAATLGTGTLALGWPRPLVYVLFFVLGFSASGWNGAFLGEVARLAPAGQVSNATGGALFFVNVSSVAAPLLFATAFTIFDSYSTSFGLLVIPSAIALLCLHHARRSSVPPAGSARDEKKPQS